MNHSDSAVQHKPRLDSRAVHKLDIRAPRYTSYPPADRFSDDFGWGDYHHQLAARSNASAPVSLYVHIPFCESLCYYCACNKVITGKHDKAVPYLDSLEREMDRVLGALGGSPEASQMHFGGGTPTFLRNQELEQLVAMLKARFPFLEQGEYSVEIDPRAVDAEKLQLLAELGFNRASLGVQDFDEQVQRAINRIQPRHMTESVLAGLRELGFHSTNFDLIYGLPHQTVTSFSATLDGVLDMSPERIALYNYAHLPDRFKSQRLIDSATIPTAETRLAIFESALDRLTSEGYVYIGMDHFARPDDELAIALANGTLHRNFQGYTTQSDCDLLAFGASAISKVGACHAQNIRSVRDYQGLVDNGDSPVVRGITLKREDFVRRDIIMGLMCGGTVDLEQIEQVHSEGASVDREWVLTRHADALHVLAGYEPLDLVRVEGTRISVLDNGRLALRALCAPFDPVLAGKDSSQVQRYSRTL